MMSTLSIRLTRKERSELENASEISGETLGGLLKLAYFGRGNVTVKKRPPADRAELARIAGQLGKYGGNINQISHSLNSGKIPPSAELIEGIREAQFQIEQAGSDVRKALGIKENKS